MNIGAAAGAVEIAKPEPLCVPLETELPGKAFQRNRALGNELAADHPVSRRMLEVEAAAAAADDFDPPTRLDGVPRLLDRKPALAGKRLRRILFVHAPKVIGGM